jgi:hypothetical protein
MPVNNSYRGTGIVYLENDNEQLVDVGNVTAFSYSAAEEKIELKNYRTPAGGNYNSDTRIESVEVSMSVSDFSAENLAIGTFGIASALTSSTVTDEAQTTPDDVSVDFLLPTDFQIDTSGTTTVTGYTEGTDFNVVAGGIIVLAAGSIPASTALAISYTSLAANKVEAFIQAAQDRRMVVDLVNTGKNNAPVRVTLHRVKFGPASDQNYIADEFGSVDLTGEALPDLSFNGTSLSQYLKIEVS